MALTKDFFKCILEISDVDFLAKEKVYNACCTACLVVEDDPDTCIVNVQRALEIMLKYISEKFLGKELFNLSAALNDNELNSFIKKNTSSETVKYIKLAGGATKTTGNKGKHENSLGADMLKATSSLAALGSVMPLLCSIISNNKLEEEENGGIEESIDGELEIIFGQHKISGKDQLEVIINNKNFEAYNEQGQSNLEYTWKILADGKNKEKTIGPKYTRFFMIDSDNYGRRVIVEVRHCDLSGTISNKDKPYLIEDKHTVVKEELPVLEGSVVLKPEYSSIDGAPIIKAHVCDSNAEEPFIYDWGTKNPDGTIFYYRKNIVGTDDGDTNKLNEYNKSGTTNRGKTIVCRVRHEGYSDEGVVSEGYGPLKKQDFKSKIIGHLKIEEGSDHNTLVAILEDTNIGVEAPKYSWSVDGGVYSDPCISPRFKMADESIGGTFVCKSTCPPSFVGEVTSEPYIVEAEPIVEAKPVAEAEPIVEAKPVAEVEPIAETEPAVVDEPVVEAEPIVEAETEAELQKETNPPIRHLLFEPAEARDYEARRYFQSLHGQVQYFACKYDDYYVLNTFEKVDYSHFIYRFLKEQGFVRVIIAEEDNGKYEFFAFDKLSALSFANPGEFKRIENVNDFDSLQIFYDNACKGGSSITPPKNARRIGTINSKGEGNHFSKHNVAEYGKRRINIPTTNNENIFHANAIQYISPALEATNAKTCIVLPIELLVSNKYLSNQIVSYIKTSFKGKITENVLLITTSSTDDFIAKIERSYSLFEELEVDINKTIARLDNGERFGTNLVKRLKSEGRILMADSLPDTDEIANLLLRKKIVEQSPLFHDIRYSKIYSIASFIRHSDEFIKSVTRIRRMSEGETELSITNLEILFNDRNIIDYLAIKSEDLDERQPIKYNNLYSSYLSRVIGPIERFVISESERDSEFNNILLEFDELVGMENVKKQVIKTLRQFKKRQDRHKENPKSKIPYMNMRFVGPPGTGKSTVADIVARLFCAEGILSNPEPMFVKPSDFQSDGAVGVIGGQIINQLEKGNHGVVVIDEFYEFDKRHSTGSMASEALEGIMSVLNDYGESICIIAAGYKDRVDATFKYNSGCKSRFPYEIKFDNYETKDLLEIFRRHIAKEGYTITEEALEVVSQIIDTQKARDGEEFGNGRYVTNTVFPMLEAELLGRDENSSVFNTEDVINAFPEYKKKSDRFSASESEILQEFDELVGMENVKKQVIKTLRQFKKRQDRHKENPKSKIPYMNMRFVGPPGTGKSTVADIVARLFCAEGILSNPEPMFVKPSDFQSDGAVGVIGGQIINQLEKGNHGVVVIDEFYEFDKRHSTGSMASEALEGIMSVLNDYGESICIIAAGYKDRVDATFKYNSGCKSRFPYEIKFDNYETKDLLEIFRRHIAKEGYTITEEALEVVSQIIDTQKARDGEEFGNGRYVTNTVFPMLEAELLMRDENSSVFNTEDVVNAFPEAVNNQDNKRSFIKRNRLSREKFNNLDEPYGGIISGDSKKIQKLDRNAVIRLNTDAGRVGTGFFIHPEGYAITCNHVVCDAAGSEAKEITARVYCYDGDDIFEIDIPVNIVYRDQHIDMALLQVNTDSEEYKEFIESHYNGNLPYLALMSESDKIKDMTGDAAVLMGFPNAKESIQTSDASISGRTINPVGIECYATMQNAYGGNSGGPIIAVESGLVIGILTGSVKDKTTGKGTEGDNYILPINYFWKDMVK